MTVAQLSGQTNPTNTRLVHYEITITTDRDNLTADTDPDKKSNTASENGQNRTTRT